MIKKLFLILILVAIGLGAAWLYYNYDGFDIKTSETKIDDTANQIKEIKKIGEWQFLNFDCQVLVDTVRKRSFFMTDDRLARIYQGSLKLGINLENAPEGWIEHHGDSLVNITLPPIQLLDDRFIDEANTTTFFEDGKWDAQTKEDMYKRAQIKMREYVLTPEYLEMARQQAQMRFESLFKALGFKEVNISFAN